MFLRFHVSSFSCFFVAYDYSRLGLHLTENCCIELFIQYLVTIIYTFLMLSFVIIYVTQKDLSAPTY